MGNGGWSTYRAPRLPLFLCSEMNFRQNLILGNRASGTTLSWKHRGQKRAGAANKLRLVPLAVKRIGLSKLLQEFKQFYPLSSSKRVWPRLRTVGAHSPTKMPVCCLPLVYR